MQRKKQDGFASLQGGKAEKLLVSHLKDGCQNLAAARINILRCSASLLSGLPGAGKVNLRKDFKCLSCGLIKYLNLGKNGENGDFGVHLR